MNPSLWRADGERRYLPWQGGAVCAYLEEKWKKHLLNPCWHWEPWIPLPSRGPVGVMKLQQPLASAYHNTQTCSSCAAFSWACPAQSWVFQQAKFILERVGGPGSRAIRADGVKCCWPLQHRDGAHRWEIVPSCPKLFGSHIVSNVSKASHTFGVCSRVW